MEKVRRVRVRVVFEGRQILSESQKKQGLKRSWFLFKPKLLKTVSDLSDYVLRIFHLHHSCPHGLVLSMDGFVLPPFESTCILKDDDVLCVRRKRERSGERIELHEEANQLDDMQIVKQPVHTGLKLLANEEFVKEKGGYESESEDEDEQNKVLEETPDMSKVSKKRKASKKIQDSKKRKRSKISTAEQSSVVVEDIQIDVSKVKRAKSCPDRSVLKKDKSSDVTGDHEEQRTTGIGETRNYISKRVPDSKRLSQLQENGTRNSDLSTTPDGTKKLPSRSARRKKAKRRWLREQVKIEKVKLHEKLLHSKVNLQASGKDAADLSSEHQQPVEDSNRYQQHPNGNLDDDIVPVVIRPGHIRFEPLDKAVDDQTVQLNQTPVETFQWNGITSKKKGQKWGKEKAAFSKKSIYETFDQVSEISTIGEDISTGKDGEFDKLPPYTSLPKEGDVIAYRLIELTLSWTPEPSSFRVGKITWYDSESNKIMLAPDPEYPIDLDRKTDDDASALQPDTFYGEDGSLQIDYSLLLDVRILKHGGGVNEVHVGDQDAVINSRDNNKHKTPQAPPQRNGDACVRDQDAVTNATNNSSKDIIPANTQENGKLNPWKEIDQVLSAKKSALLQADDQSTKQSANRRSSYKRNSALGPTMAFLRSQNGL